MAEGATTPTKIPDDSTGLSIGYRFFWRVQYTLLAWGGPAQLPLHRDPRERMRRERAARVAAATMPPASVERTSVPPDATPIRATE